MQIGIEISISASKGAGVVSEPVELAHVAGIRYTATSFFAGNPTANLFDGNTATFWLGTGAGVDTVYLDIGVNKLAVPTSYGVRASNSNVTTRPPKNWTFQASVDGITWDTLDTRTNQTAWSSLQLRSFTVSTGTWYRFFRLAITANNGDATYTEFGEFYVYGLNPAAIGAQFAPTTMTTDNAPSPYVASQSSFYTGINQHKCWRTLSAVNDSWVGTGNGVEWVSFDLGSAARICNKYEIQIWEEFTRAPKNWTLQGSNNGTAWTTIATVANSTGWNAMGRVFDVTDVSTAYRYYKIDITANNGAATYTKITHFYLYE